ncbi:MAG: hypothetical protein ACERK6_10550 [Candidatus Aminicenantaceae bacterium]
MRPWQRLLTIVIGLGLVGICVLSASPQEAQHFYNVDREVDITGTVHEVIMEPRYQDKAAFLTVVLEEKKTGRRYTVEISPAWFFEQDLHQGESLRITGSLVAEGKVNLVMARQVQMRGEMMAVRDKHGFPNWRGGRGRQKKRWKR